MKKQILLVEDEKSYAELVMKKLENAGFNVYYCASGQEAVDYLEHHTPDLAILDILLPDIDGLTILNEIATNERFYRMPVIILSNLDEPGSFEQARAIGDYEYLIKVHTSLDEIVSRVNDKLHLD